MLLAFAAVVQLVLTELFFLGESLEARVEADGFCLLQPTCFDAGVLYKQLQTQTQIYKDRQRDRQTDIGKCQGRWVLSAEAGLPPR